MSTVELSGVVLREVLITVATHDPDDRTEDSLLEQIYFDLFKRIAVHAYNKAIQCKVDPLELTV